MTKEQISKKLKQFKIKDDKLINEGFKGMGNISTPYVLKNWLPCKTVKRDHVN